MNLIQPRFIGLASAIALLAVLLACGWGTAEVPAERSASSIGISNPTPNIGVVKAPSFTVSTGGGSTFSLEEHRGEVVILYFSFPG